MLFTINTNGEFMKTIKVRNRQYFEWELTDELIQYQIDINLSDQEMIDDFFNPGDLTVAEVGDKYYEAIEDKNTLLTKIQDYIDNLDKKIQSQDVQSEDLYHEIAKNARIATTILIRDDLINLIKDAKHD